MAKTGSKRKMLIIIAAIVTVIFFIGGGFVFKMINEQKTMNALETGEFLPGIYAVNNVFVNLFLIKNGDTYIAIDAGSDVNGVKEGLSQLGISSDDVTAVLMTHTHGDHTAGLKIFDKATVYGVNPRVVNRILSDGETFTVDGKEVRCFSTPGHTDDSVCYLYDGKYLFAGDNMSLKDNKVELFNSVYNKSDDQQRIDIAKLAELSGVEYIITAHYGYTNAPVFP